MVSRFRKSMNRNFLPKYAHESTVIEGNTYSTDEARKIPYGIYRVDPGATDRQREVYEIAIMQIHFASEGQVSKEEVLTKI